jgi:hypothetical protein
MDDKKSASDNPQKSWPQLLILSVAVAGMALAKYNQEQIGRSSRDWLWMGISGLMALVTFLDARNGTAQISFKTYKRSDDPITFWTIVVILCGLFGGLFFGSLGDLLGLWQFDPRHT